MQDWSLGFCFVLFFPAVMMFKKIKKHSPWSNLKHKCLPGMVSFKHMLLSWSLFPKRQPLSGNIHLRFARKHNAASIFLCFYFSFSKAFIKCFALICFQNLNWGEKNSLSLGLFFFFFLGDMVGSKLLILSEWILFFLFFFFKI